VFGTSPETSSFPIVRIEAVPPVRIPAFGAGETGAFAL